MSRATFLIREIKDEYVQENFKRLKEFFRFQAMLAGEWRFFEITFDDPTIGPTNHTFQHRLGFQPKDIIQTSLVSEDSDAIWIWNYNEFSRESLSITTTQLGTKTVRAFIGRYQEGSEP